MPAFYRRLNILGSFFFKEQSKKIPGQINYRITVHIEINNAQLHTVCVCVINIIIVIESNRSNSIIHIILVQGALIRLYAASVIAFSSNCIKYIHRQSCHAPCVAPAALPDKFFDLKKISTSGPRTSGLDQPFRNDFASCSNVKFNETRFPFRN